MQFFYSSAIFKPFKVIPESTHIQKFNYSYTEKTNKKSKTNSVFLNHVGIRQMPTWLPTWKAKSLYHVGTFLPTWFFLPLGKFKTIKIPKPKQIRAHYIFQGILKIFSNVYALANCKQLKKCNRLYRSSLSAFFSIDIRSNQFRVDLYL